MGGVFAETPGIYLIFQLFCLQNDLFFLDVFTDIYKITVLWADVAEREKDQNKNAFYSRGNFWSILLSNALQCKGEVPLKF